jgi:hypothetical protein
MSDAPIDDTGGEGGEGGAGGGEGGDGAGAPAASWRDTLPDELKADATLLKFDSIDALARSHVDLKRQFGAEKIVLPKGDDDAEGWSAAFKALGRPEKPEDYTFPTLAEGESSPLADALRPKLFEAGLNQRQVGMLDTALTEVLTAEAEAEAQKGVEEINAIKGEVGEAAFKAMSDRARAAATAFGVSEAQADKLDRILGSGDLVKLFDSIGKRMGEGTFRGGDLPEGFAISADPKKQLDELQADKAWVEKLNGGDVNVGRQRKALIAAIAAQQNGG